MPRTSILIAFFSRSGQNYVQGKIVDLPVGNTEIIAKKLQSLTYGILFQIKTHDYPEDYTQCTEVAKQELRNNVRPPVIGTASNIGDFGTFKRCRDFVRSRYVGLAKVEQEFFLVALSYNLVRARTLCFS